MVELPKMALALTQKRALKLLKFHIEAGTRAAGQIPCRLCALLDAQVRGLRAGIASDMGYHAARHRAADSRRVQDGWCGGACSPRSPVDPAGAYTAELRITVPELPKGRLRTSNFVVRLFEAESTASRGRARRFTPCDLPLAPERVSAVIDINGAAESAGSVKFLADATEVSRSAL